MEDRGSKEEKAIGVDNLTQDDQVKEEFSHIIDRNHLSKREYYWLWGSILVLAYCTSFEAAVSGGVQNYITAYFGVTSLTALLPTIMAALSTALVPLYTKVSDVFGRAGSLTFAFTSYLLGLIIAGSAHSYAHLGVGEIVNGIGATGINTLSQVVIADTTSLLQRGMMFAMYDVGQLINIWVSQALIDPLTLGGPRDKWRMAYIITGCVAGFGAIFFLIPLWHITIQLKRRQVARPPRRSLRWLLTEFDVVGAVLMTSSLALTCIPLMIARRTRNNWNDAGMITMMCLGASCFIALLVWYAKFATRPILSRKVWSNRTVFGGLMIMFLLKLMGHVSWQYLSQFLFISRDLSFGQIKLLVCGYGTGWLAAQLISAFIMRKWKCPRILIWVGIVVYITGCALMIPARHSHASSALIVLSQSMGGIGGGLAFLPCSVLVTGVVHKRDIASVIGATQILVWFGAGVGGAISGGIWTQYLPTQLHKYVTGPFDELRAMNDPLKYVKNLDPVTKAQVVEAYSSSQKLMSIVGLAFAALTLLCAAMLEHVDLEQDQDTQDRIAMGMDTKSQEDDDSIKVKAKN
ncbi:hypothetical protein BGZ52_010022 [Haplosporangium bisporale]|nr:hypothetical protein BGZ52_010022 [Haplosporangium bisporale]KAF9213215.1 hypothetical protein BGZ59_005695 [Podila verticillata]KFH64239.1 hypothetical protein MVEG_10064 [Podila verticillata NRRL 6337]